MVVDVSQQTIKKKILRDRLCVRNLLTKEAEGKKQQQVYELFFYHRFSRNFLFACFSNDNWQTQSGQPSLRQRLIHHVQMKASQCS